MEENEKREMKRNKGEIRLRFTKRSIILLIPKKAGIREENAVRIGATGWRKGLTVEDCLFVRNEIDNHIDRMREIRNKYASVILSDKSKIKN